MGRSILQTRTMGRWLAAAGSLGFSAVWFGTGAAPSVTAQSTRLLPPVHIAPPSDHGEQFTTSRLHATDTQTTSFLRADTARAQFSVDGTGLTLAVLDTGLRTTHVDFANNKVVARRNFTTDDGGNVNIVTDGNGHGTNVAGIAVARGIHTGIAPGANVIPLKVLTNSGSGSFASVDSALGWVLSNAATYKISAVNLSLGDGSNYTADSFTGDAVRAKIQQLRSQKIAVLCAAGNDFFSFNSQQGMGYPAIIRETISVGALYDANIGRVQYGSGAVATTTAAGRFCPFSQRLHPNVNAATRTDIFVPGAALTSAGIANDNAESTYHGTSQATPTAAGLVLLAQHYVQKRTGQLPTVDQLEKWLRTATARTVQTDGDDENDNVTNTGLQFASGDAVDMLTAAKTELDGITPPTTSNVTASYVPSTLTLTLTGDAGANSITLQPSGSTLRITAATGTTVNGAASASYSIANYTNLKIIANMGSGNDIVTLTSLRANTVTANLQDGADRLSINYSAILQLRVDGGTGTDTLTTTGSSISRRTVTNVP